MRLVTQTETPLQVQATPMVQQPVWHRLPHCWALSELGNHRRKRLLHLSMIPVVSRVFDHLLDNLPQLVLPSPLDIQLTTTLDRLQRDLDKLLTFKELIPYHLVLRQVAHLSGARIHVSTINFNLTLTHSFQLRPLLRALLKMFRDRCEC